MKRTDFTQNFPGGIIKGDSRCREGEEMEEKIDLNVCYRRAFEALGITGSVQKFTDYITEYVPVVLIVLDIGGKILAMSHKGEYNENPKNQHRHPYHQNRETTERENRVFSG